MTAVRLATRGSALALRQTELVAAALGERSPDVQVEVVIVRTIGDANQSAPIAALGDGVFVRGVEAEILADRADGAVHSAKDVPTAETPGLTLAAFPPRADARDALISREGHTLAGLPTGARLGTASPRRAALARSLRPDLDITLIRGNVDTRLRRLREGEYDAIVLAVAGLDRMGLLGRATEFLDPDVWTPAPGQGALAVQCRAGSVVEPLLATIDDPDTRVALTAERAVLLRLGSGCRTPVGAYAVAGHGRVRLRATLTAPDGQRSVRADLSGLAADAAALGAAAADELMAKGSDILV